MRFGDDASLIASQEISARNPEESIYRNADSDVNEKRLELSLMPKVIFGKTIDAEIKHMNF